MAQQHENESEVSRRSVLATAAAGLGWAALAEAEALAENDGDAPLPRKDPLKITKLETFLVKPRWLFLKVHTDAGIVGLGEPILEGRAKTCATAVKEIEPYLIGKDPRQVAHHWLAIYLHGATSPALAKVLIKALEPYAPMFIEEPINCQNHDVMAEIARGTHLPIATGERVFTK